MARNTSSLWLRRWRVLPEARSLRRPTGPPTDAHHAWAHAAAGGARRRRRASPLVPRAVSTRLLDRHARELALLGRSSPPLVPTALRSGLVNVRLYGRAVRVRA